MRLLIIVLAIGAVGYAAMAATMFFSQNSLLFLPDMPGREIFATPDDVGLRYEPVTIDTADGVALHGWMVPAEQALATLLFFHGNAGNISHRLDSIKIFHDLGLDVLIVDYRGYGRSTGTPSEQGVYRDAQAAWRYLTEQRRVAPHRIVLFGRSLGGAVATWLAARTQPAALIIESTFTSAPALGAELYPWLPVRWLARLQFDTRGTLASIQAPVMVVHSREDEIIPFHHAQANFETVKAPKQFLGIRGGHNDGFYVSGREYKQGLRAFIAAYITQ